MRLIASVTAFVLVGVLAQSAGAAPVAYAPALGVLHVDPQDNPDELVQISISGENFGPRTAANLSYRANHCGQSTEGSFVVVYNGTSQLKLLKSSDNGDTPYWLDKQIVFRVSKQIGNKPNLKVKVCTQTGGTATVSVARYTYAHYNVPVSPSASFPLALTRHPSGDLYVNEEGHSQLKRMTAQGQWTTWNIPQIAGDGIFATTIYCPPPGPGQPSPPECRSRNPLNGEAILVDPQGRVWMSESGQYAYPFSYHNHSRIIMYDPVTLEMKVYNVPGDNDSVFGIAWADDRIWFTQQQRGAVGVYPPQIALNARLTSFDPEHITPDGAFDFFQSGETCDIEEGDLTGSCSEHDFVDCVNDRDCILAEQVCPPDVEDDSACFHQYEIPNDALFLPAHVLAHSDGAIWYSGYWNGRQIGRLDLSTDPPSFKQYPVPDPVSLSEPPCTNLPACDCFEGTAFDDPTKGPCPANRTFCCNAALTGAAPWNLVEEATQDIVFAQQNQASIARFDHSRWNDPACLSLSGGQNPCITNHFVPNLNPSYQFHHSVEVDGSGNVWITQFQIGLQSNCSLLTSLGFLQAGTDRVLMFPPLSFYGTGGGTCTTFAGCGMAYEPTTGGMWFADFWRKRIGKLTPP